MLAANAPACTLSVCAAIVIVSPEYSFAGLADALDLARGRCRRSR